MCFNIYCQCYDYSLQRIFFKVHLYVNKGEEKGNRIIIKICKNSCSEVSNLTHFHTEKTEKVTGQKETLFHCDITKPCHKLPREDRESPSLEIFKSCPDTNLDNRPWVVLFKQKVGLDDLPSSLNHSVIYETLCHCFASQLKQQCNLWFV